MVRAETVLFGNAFETVVEGHEDREVGHAEGDVHDFADGERQIRTDFHHVGFIRAEDADRTPGFGTVQVFAVRIVRGAFIVVAHDRLHVGERNLLFGLEVDGEVAAVVHGLFDRGVQDLLHDPDARVVVDAVAAVVARVGGGEVEGALLRVVEALFRGERDERRAGELVFVFGIVEAEASLVARSEVAVGRDAFGHPLMARARFEIPDVVLIDEGDAEAFARTLRFNDLAEKEDAFLGRAAARQDHVRDVVFGDARGLVVGVERERFVAREDRFRAREAEAGFVEADGAVQLGLPVGNRRVAHGVFGKRIAEVVHAAVGLAGIDTRLAGDGRVNDEVLRLEGRAVRAARDEEGTVNGGVFADDDGSAHGLGPHETAERVDRKCPAGLITPHIVACEGPNYERSFFGDCPAGARSAEPKAEMERPPTGRLPSGVVERSGSDDAAASSEVTH